MCCDIVINNGAADGGIIWVLYSVFWLGTLALRWLLFSEAGGRGWPAYS